MIIPVKIAVPRIETEHIDKDGDLALEVECIYQGEEPWKKRFVVCSKTLARASPVFKKMLYGGFAESKKPTEGGDIWTVQLPDDDHDALELLLDIMHANFDKLPRNPLALDDLYHITVLTDKYDMRHLLRPWISQWEEEARGYNIWTPEQETRDCILEKRLWIAWELGLQGRLRDLVRRLARFSSLNTQGKLISKGEDGQDVLRFRDTLTPPGLEGWCPF